MHVYFLNAEDVWLQSSQLCNDRSEKVSELKIPADDSQFHPGSFGFSAFRVGAVLPAHNAPTWWKCKLVGFSDTYDGSGSTYIIEHLSKQWGTERYPLSASTLWDRLTKKQQGDVEAGL